MDVEGRIGHSYVVKVYIVRTTLGEEIDKMNEKFFDLSREKQDRMINGAVEVFAKNGFKHASTDDMVKAVEVSKGLWFHYFGSKLGLYNFVYGYSVKYIILELSSILDPNEKDFFEVTKQIEFTKMRISKKYPYMTRFLEQAQREPDAEVRAQITEDQKMYCDKMDSFFKDADIFHVDDKAQKEKIKKLVHQTVNGILYETPYDKENAESVYKEIRSQIELIRELTNTKSQQQPENEEKTATAAS